MLLAFFAQAAQSPGRQVSLRRAVVAHVVLLAGALAVASTTDDGGRGIVGHVALLAGIVEGAVLIGWRLTQLPRSQALEFLLVSPVHPRRVFLAEAAVGLGRLALVTASGLPVLALFVAHGVLVPDSVLPLVVVPWTWGALTGLGLAAWAYEPRPVRQWGERLAMVGVVVYLVLGVLLGERFMQWLMTFDGLLPTVVRAFLDHNPFGLVKDWLTLGGETVLGRAVAVEAVTLAVLAVITVRASTRLLPHYDERHYQPAVDRSGRLRTRVDDRPLSWWAVKRVAQYSGRINLWLAGGFALAYAAYLLAGDAWPVWLGRRVFTLADDVGGVATLATSLVLLGAVPASFQYGLWDSSASDRCRRLELLLLTRLGPRDYWDAAAAAAWSRGRGYFLLAALLGLAGVFAGRLTVAQYMAASAAGVVLWCLYFTLGFRAFSRGMQANGLGLMLTVGVPLVTICLARGHVPDVAPLLPPGSVHAAASAQPGLLWCLGPIVASMITLAIAHLVRTRCDAELRTWYEKHHGAKGVS